MKHLFKVFGSLFGAKRKVKLLGLFLLISSANANAGGKIPYGPYVVNQAVLWLPDYLDALLISYRFADSLTAPQRRTMELLTAIETQATQFRHDNFTPEHYMEKGSPFLQTRLKSSGRIKFRKGGDKIFDLKSKPPRMAVTGTAIDSDVIFNLGLIADPRTFTFADALALWVHELGHKIPGEYFTQEEIDAAAGIIARRSALQMHIYRAGEMEILVLNPVPYSKEGDHMTGPFRGFPQRRASLFAVLEGNAMTDLGSALDAELDRFAHPRSNKLEIKRPIISVVKLKENPRELELRLELRTARLPKNMNYYVMDEIGPNYHKSVRVTLSRDLKSLKATHYVDEPLPRPMILDAAADISAPSITLDRKQLSGTLKLELKNQTHFHAAGYPDSYFTLFALLDGEPVSLEAKIRWRLEDSNFGGMPHEVYKKSFIKEGRFTVDISELNGSELEIIGMQDRFFTYGGGWTPPAEEEKRVRVLEPMSVILPGTCMKDLLP